MGAVSSHGNLAERLSGRSTGGAPVKGAGASRTLRFGSFTEFACAKDSGTGLAFDYLWEFDSTCRRCS
jgi:hypothetical protein